MSTALLLLTRLGLGLGLTRLVGALSLGLTGAALLTLLRLRLTRLVRTLGRLGLARTTLLALLGLGLARLIGALGSFSLAGATLLTLLRLGLTRLIGTLGLGLARTALLALLGLRLLGAATVGRRLRPIGRRRGRLAL